MIPGITRVRRNGSAGPGKEESYYCLERNYGVFHRSFPLPGTVDEEKINARMNNGVLEIHLPKKEAAKPRQIKVAA